MAAAVMEIWPDTKRTIGPAIENGFYFDFEFASPISESDLPRIDQKMRELVKSWKGFEKHELSAGDAKKEYPNNPYKHELIEEFTKNGEKVSFYKSGSYWDLCKGGHVENPREQLKHFKLLSVAGAYWRGDEKNKMLTRIYGTAFATKEELEKYLWQMEEAKKRDNRKLGKDLELYLISQQIGSGLPILMPKGALIKKIIEDDLYSEKRKIGYQFVWSSHIAKSQIYHTSGHWGKYDAMFAPMKLDDEDYVLKPMNCPHHFQYYLNSPRSYKELPFRIAETATVYRNEKSGELGGLLRVRSLTIDDGHTFIRLDQTNEELELVLVIIKKILERYGFREYRARISTSDPDNQQKYLGDRDAWVRAEEALKKQAEKLFDSVSVGVGEAAFYGPKIDVMVKDAVGREWQLSTVQLDYNQPKNFEMKYTDENGEEVYPAIVHVAMIGSIERFMGILIEHYAGAFPLWLAPVQVKIVPVSEKFGDYAKKVKDMFNAASIRTELDMDAKSLGYKIRQATLQKVPYMIIIGEKESASGSDMLISVRSRDGKDLGTLSASEFLKKLQNDIEHYL